MHNYLLPALLGLAGLTLLILTIYKYRNENLPLEQRYAKEITAGTAIIIPKYHHHKKKKLLLLIILLATLLSYREFYQYIKYLNQNCTTIYGWDSSVVGFGVYFFTIYIGTLTFLSVSYYQYKKMLKDGFVPPKDILHLQDQISLKLTKKILIKERIKLTVLTLMSLFLFSSPFLMMHTFSVTAHHHISLLELNEALKKACLNDLNKKK